VLGWPARHDPCERESRITDPRQVSLEDRIGLISSARGDILYFFCSLKSIGSCDHLGTPDERPVNGPAHCGECGSAKHASESRRGMGEPRSTPDGLSRQARWHAERDPLFFLSCDRWLEPWQIRRSQRGEWDAQGGRFPRSNLDKLEGYWDYPIPGDKRLTIRSETFDEEQFCRI
jgi:hypothetical protein